MNDKLENTYQEVKVIETRYIWVHIWIKEQKYLAV